MEKWGMGLDEDYERNQKRIQALRSMLRDEVKAILASGNKQLIPSSEIQKRMDKYLRQQLDTESNSTEIPPTAEIYKDGRSIEQITVGDAMSETANDILQELNTGENYGENYTDAIIELVKSGTIQSSEISEENARQLVKAFMIMRVKLNQILAARYKGNFSLEKTLLSPEPSYSNTQPNIYELPDSKQSILISELIEKYIFHKHKWR